ncbi:uncharacterized protein [Diadema setosum]|uniref:uncharacterized protein n=1 Tax=Diadema setosum TaxID=31175 RepID=UPI003B3A33A8
MSPPIFTSIATELVKQVSQDLIPAPDLLYAKKCGPGHLIVKKNKNWFWQREKITPTAFKLSDILRHEDVDKKLEPFHLPPIISEDKGKFNSAQKFFAKGTGKMNDNGQRLLELCCHRGVLCVTNTYFKAFSVFGKKAGEKLDETQPHAEAKRKTLLTYKQNPISSTHNVLRTASNMVQQTASRCANDFWLNLCRRIQTAALSGNARDIYDIIKATIGPTAIKTAPLKTKTGEAITEGDCSDCNNYRGISLLSVVGKVFARVVLARLQSLAFRVYPESQCGFRAGNLEASVPQGYVDVELGGGNSVTISFDLVNIVDNSLPVPSLVDAVSNRKIDPSHALVREAMSDSRNSLCLVVTSLNNKSEVDVKTINKVEVDGNVGVGVGGTKLVGVGGQVFSEGTRCLQIPANTAMAFRMHDLHIRADQTMQILLLPGSEGGFEKMELKSTGGHDIKTYLEAEAEVEEDPGRELWNEITEGMEAIFDLPDDGLSVIRKSLIELMTTPLDKLNDMLQSAVNHLIVGDECSKVSCAALDEMLGGVSLNAHKDLLRVAGFVFGETEVTYPGSDKDGVLNCLADLLDVMAALGKDQRDKLLQCTENERSALMEMLAESISVDPLPLDPTRVTGLTQEFPHVESLLVSVGLHRERMDEKWYLCQGSQQTGGESVTPGEMLAVIFALWGR